MDWFVGGNASSKLINKVSVLQRKALRIINKNKYNSHCYNCKLYQRVSVFKDLKCGRLPISFNNYLSTRSDNSLRPTRQSDILYTSIPRTTFSINLPNHNFPRLWNNFNFRNINTDSRHSFRKQVTNYYIKTYSENVHCGRLTCTDCTWLYMIVCTNLI